MLLKIIKPFGIVLIIFVTVYSQGIHQTVDQYILKKDFEIAEKIAKKAVAKNPKDVESICALACVYRNQSYKEIVKIDASAMGIKDGENGTYVIKDSTDLNRLISSSTIIDTSYFNKAEALYFKILSIDSSYLNAYFNLLNTYAVIPDFDKYFRTIDLFINNLGNSNDTKYYLLDLAGQLLANSYYNEAIILYSKILEKYSDFTDAKSDLGAVYFKQGKILKAAKFFKDVYKSKPDDIINLTNYYNAAIFSENFEIAYKLNLELIKKDQDNQTLFLDAGLLALLLGKNADNFLNNYIASRGKNMENPKEDFWIQFSKMLLKLENNHSEEKSEYLHFVLDEFNKGGYDKYALFISNILDQYDLTNFSLIVHASLFDRMNFLEKTLEYLDKIKKRNENGQNAMAEKSLLYNYGRIYYANGQYGNAEPYFRKYYQISDSNAIVNHLLGMCYLNVGKVEEAKKIFKHNKGLNDKSQMEYINRSIQQLNKLYSTFNKSFNR